MLRGVVDGDKGKATEQVYTALHYLEEAFVKCSQGKLYFGGNNIGFLDIVLGSHLGWFKVVEKIAGVKILDETQFPKLTAWAAQFCAHQVVKDVMPNTDRLVEFSATLNAALNAKASQ